MNYFANMMRAPLLIQAFKKVCADLLVERYANHEAVIAKLAKIIETDEDYVAFANLMTEIYESGYLRSVEDHRKVLKQKNINIEFKRLEPVEKSSSIFPQEKSG